MACPPSGSPILIEKAAKKPSRCLLPPQIPPRFCGEAGASLGGGGAPLLEGPETQLLGTGEHPRWNPQGVFHLLMKHHGASRVPWSRLFSKGYRS